MAETDPMSVAERRKYLHKMRLRYWQAKRKSERNRLLDEMEAVTGLHRKSLLRLLGGETGETPSQLSRISGEAVYTFSGGAAVRWSRCWAANNRDEARFETSPIKRLL